MSAARTPTQSERCRLCLSVVFHLQRLVHCCRCLEGIFCLTFSRGCFHLCRNVVVVVVCSGVFVSLLRAIRAPPVHKIFNGIMIAIQFCFGNEVCYIFFPPNFMVYLPLFLDFISLTLQLFLQYYSSFKTPLLSCHRNYVTKDFEQQIGDLTRLLN